MQAYFAFIKAYWSFLTIAGFEGALIKKEIDQFGLTPSEKGLCQPTTKPAITSEDADFGMKWALTSGDLYEESFAGSLSPYHPKTCEDTAELIYHGDIVDVYGRGKNKVKKMLSGEGLPFLKKALREFILFVYAAMPIEMRDTESFRFAINMDKVSYARMTLPRMTGATAIPAVDRFMSPGLPPTQKLQNYLDCLILMRDVMLDYNRLIDDFGCVHGDFNYGNICQNTTQWSFIDFGESLFVRESGAMDRRAADQRKLRNSFIALLKMVGVAMTMVDDALNAAIPPEDAIYFIDSLRSAEFPDLISLLDSFISSASGALSDTPSIGSFSGWLSSTSSSGHASPTNSWSAGGSGSGSGGWS